MESKHLRYFLAIADTGSLTHAAIRLGVAQPALSHALTKMERELGVKLFDRSRRGATLTTAGEAIVDDIRLSLARMDAAARRASEIGAQRAGRLSIGFVSAALFGTLPSAVCALRAAAPRVDLVMREMSNAEQVVALERGEIDIGILHTPVAIGGPVNEKLIRRDPLIAVIPKSFPRQPDGTITLRELSRAGLIWFPHEQLPSIRAAILSAFRLAGHPIEVVLDANRTLTVIACVAAGCGVSLLPSSIRTLTFEGVDFSTVADGQALPEFPLTAIWPKRSRRTLADRFAELLPQFQAS
ncbi:LysR family transcriptional regulator [Burkholderia mayonis]|uniref:LysR family transcriptional regulator n=1 Tax=Burkholderia mayonis TaxID=1385591 RepID=A0A1B4FER9_9BURK|nr:LysR family transcriptional regulator [Burkholderia mayonis]AOJ02190.1 LysR family transcriptional regulator [Burkholderia mayonis]KVE44135.1 LysR family transcriptional regulator [Burkholderia mayonis]